MYRGVFSTLGDIIEYTGCVQYTGGYHDECGGYHEYTEGCSLHWGFHTMSIVFPMTFPHIYHDTPGVLMKSPQCTEQPPLYCTPQVYCTNIMQGDKTNYRNIQAENKTYRDKNLTVSSVQDLQN